MPLRQSSDLSKHCLFCNDYNEKQERNTLCLFLLASTNNGSRHRVRPLHWKWQGCGWSSCNSESQGGEQES